MKYNEIEHAWCWCKCSYHFTIDRWKRERKEENLVTIISTRCKRRRGGRSGKRERERETQNIVKLQRRRWKNKKRRVELFLNRRGWISAGKAIQYIPSASIQNSNLHRIGKNNFPSMRLNNSSAAATRATNKQTHNKTTTCVCECVWISHHRHTDRHNRI